MATPPLQLEEIVYERVLVEALPSHQPDVDGSATVVSEANLARVRDDADQWRVELTVTVSADDGPFPPPYAVEVCCVGVFRVLPGVAKEGAEDLVAVSGTSVLYSSVRDFLMTVTSRGPWGSYMLPTASFSELDDQLASLGPGIDTEVVRILDEYGPLRVGELSAIAGIDRLDLRPILSELLGEGEVERIGRGAGTRYRVPETEL